MTSHDSRPTDGLRDDKDIPVRSADDSRSEPVARPALGSPIPENPDELYEPASRLTLQGDAYGAFGNDHESASAASHGSTAANAQPAHAPNEDAYGRDGQPDRHFGYNRKGPVGATSGVIQSDEGIRQLVCERLIHDRLVDVSDVTLAVSHGCVTLKGTIPDHRMSALIEDVVSNCPDVKAVTNQIQTVSGGSGPWSAGD